MWSQCQNKMIQIYTLITSLDTFLKQIEVYEVLTKISNELLNILERWGSQAPSKKSSLTLHLQPKIYTESGL